MPISKEKYYQILEEKLVNQDELALKVKTISQKVKDSTMDLPEFEQIDTTEVIPKNVQSLRIESDIINNNWEKSKLDWFEIKLNPSKDVLEFLNWPLKGIQFFNLSAWKREAEAIWSRILSASEYEKIIDEVWNEEFKNIAYGLIDEDRKRLSFTGEKAVFWVESDDDYKKRQILVWEGNFTERDILSDQYCSILCIKK